MWNFATISPKSYASGRYMMGQRRYTDLGSQDSSSPLLDVPSLEEIPSLISGDAQSLSGGSSAPNTPIRDPSIIGELPSKGRQDRQEPALTCTKCPKCLQRQGMPVDSSLPADLSERGLNTPIVSLPRVDVRERETYTLNVPQRVEQRMGHRDEHSSRFVELFEPEHHDLSRRLLGQSHNSLLAGNNAFDSTNTTRANSVEFEEQSNDGTKRWPAPVFHEYPQDLAREEYINSRNLAQMAMIDERNGASSDEDGEEHLVQMTRIEEGNAASPDENGGDQEERNIEPTQDHRRVGVVVANEIITQSEEELGGFSPSSLFRRLSAVERQRKSLTGKWENKFGRRFGSKSRPNSFPDDSSSSVPSPCPMPIIPKESKLKETLRKIGDFFQPKRKAKARARSMHF